MKKVLISLIRLYRVIISPVLPVSCRFIPTCSEYAIEAIERHGAMRGSYLLLRRLLRCHPFHPGGYDPVSPVRRFEGDYFKPLSSHPFRKSFTSPISQSGPSNEVKR